MAETRTKEAEKKAEERKKQDAEEAAKRKEKMAARGAAFANKPADLPKAAAAPKADVGDLAAKRKAMAAKAEAMAAASATPKAAAPKPAPAANKEGFAARQAMMAGMKLPMFGAPPPTFKKKEAVVEDGGSADGGSSGAADGGSGGASGEITHKKKGGGHGKRKKPKQKKTDFAAIAESMQEASAVAPTFTIQSAVEIEVVDLANAIQDLDDKFQAISAEEIKAGGGAELTQILNDVVLPKLLKLHQKHEAELQESVQLYNKLANDIPRRVQEVLGEVKLEEEGDEVALCARCEKELSGTTIEAIGAFFHSACFTCFTCSRPFISSCLNINGKPYCDLCGSKAYAALKAGK